MSGLFESSKEANVARVGVRVKEAMWAMCRPFIDQGARGGL